MNSTTVILALFMGCVFQMATSLPIVEPFLSHQSPQLGRPEFDPNQRADADEFMRSNGVTQEEIEEYHRMTGFNPPVDSEMGDERMFGLGSMIKYWNWSMYDRFRQWIAGRRHTTTTYRPIVVINQFDRPTHVNNIPARH